MLTVFGYANFVIPILFLFYEMSSRDSIESTQEDDVKIVENVIDLYRTNVSFYNQPIKYTYTPL